MGTQPAIPPRLVTSNCHSDAALAHILALYERERQLMVYDLHDGVAQDLAAALTFFEAFQGWRDDDPAKAQEAWEQGLQLLQQGLAETRRLMHGLQPPVLEQEGLVPALETLVHERRREGGPQIHLHCRLHGGRRPAIFENVVYRIVQESLANACHHSQSPTVRVELSEVDGQLLIAVRDRGIGFEMAQVPQGRLGLRGIQERARLFGGHATVTTVPQEGTSVTVQLPLIEAL